MSHLACALWVQRLSVKAKEGEAGGTEARLFRFGSEEKMESLNFIMCGGDGGGQKGIV